MPGMMDTILNLGLNDDNVKKLADKTGDARFAYDCYRRLLQMFGEVVYNVRCKHLIHILKIINNVTTLKMTLQLQLKVYKKFVNVSKTFIWKKFINRSSRTLKQLEEAIEAVFKSWDNDRARIYRDLNDIPHDIGTAVNIQEMVFGNSGNNSGTGVAFTRNPVSGENKLFGEYLLNAQGEDVVAGIRTPKDISTLHDQMPDVHQEFVEVTKQLEQHYKDMQDIEFTIENGKLYLLQTRNGKRTARAAIKIAVDLVDEGVIKKKKRCQMLM